MREKDELINIWDREFKALVVFSLIAIVYSILGVGLFLIITILREGLGLRTIPLVIIIVVGLIFISLRLIKLFKVPVKDFIKQSKTTQNDNK